MINDQLDFGWFNDKDPDATFGPSNKGWNYVSPSQGREKLRKRRNKNRGVSLQYTQIFDQIKKAHLSGHFYDSSYRRHRSYESMLPQEDSNDFIVTNDGVERVTNQVTKYIWSNDINENYFQKTTVPRVFLDQLREFPNYRDRLISAQRNRLKSKKATKSINKLLNRNQQRSISRSRLDGVKEFNDEAVAREREQLQDIQEHLTMPEDRLDQIEKRYRNHIRYSNYQQIRRLRRAGSQLLTPISNGDMSPVNAMQLMNIMGGATSQIAGRAGGQFPSQFSGISSVLSSIVTGGSVQTVALNGLQQQINVVVSSLDHWEKTLHDLRASINGITQFTLPSPNRELTGFKRAIRDDVGQFYSGNAGDFLYYGRRTNGERSGHRGDLTQTPFYPLDMGLKIFSKITGVGTTKNLNVAQEHQWKAVKAQESGNQIGFLNQHMGVLREIEKARQSNEWSGMGKAGWDDATDYLKVQSETASQLLSVQFGNINPIRTEADSWQNVGNITGDYYSQSMVSINEQMLKQLSEINFQLKENLNITELF